MKRSNPLDFEQYNDEYNSEGYSHWDPKVKAAPVYRDPKTHPYTDKEQIDAKKMKKVGQKLYKEYKEHQKPEWKEK